MIWNETKDSLPPLGEYVLVCCKNALNPEVGYALVEWGGEGWVETFANVLEGPDHTREEATFVVGDIPRDEFSHWALLTPPEGI